ncbi:ABC transporter substrate-binding protein [Nocardioides ginsengisoli]|uniref:ABC transporter substrate-binding protein n=1 Tax=Nocardioides ginsengisoli TaxID=363868 RepID=A0ABW3W6A4_9ACTN
MRIPTSRIHQLAVGATAGTVLLAACGQSPDAKPATPELKVTTVTPKAAGDLDSATWAVASEPSSMDWIYNASFDTGQIMANVCEGLLRLDPDLHVEPALAESYVNPTPTTWVYTLKPGVTFHDGTTLTAEDVAFSLNRNLDKAAGSFWSGAYVNVKSITATGPLEVTVELTKPDALWNSYLSSPAGIVDSKKTVEAKGKAYGTPDGGVNCVGPYALTKWDKGQSITVTRDDHYFDPAHRAKIAKLTFTFVRDPAAEVNGLLSGTIDGAWFLPPSSLAKLSKSGVGTVYYGKSTQGFNAIVMDMSGPLKDVRIRQALSMAIDRNGIIRAVAGGAAQPQKAPAVPGSWGYAEPTFQSAWDGLAVTERNLDAARKLVKEAGAPDRPIVIATTNGEAEVPVIGAEIQSAAKQIGLDVEIKTFPADAYNGVYTDAKARKGIDLYLTGWGTDFADPVQMYQYFQTGNFYNFTGFSDPKYDALVDEAAQTMDGAKRAELITQAQQIVVDQLLWIPLYAPYNTLFLNKRVTGSPASYVQLHYPWAADLGAAR